MKKDIIEIVGWVGTVAIVIGYFFVSFGLLSGTSFVFQLLNLFGAIGVIIVCFYKKTYQPAVLNILWALIAFVAALQIILK